jgi:diguanylate cyclase (GGDEF)-like protein
MKITDPAGPQKLAAIRTYSRNTAAAEPRAAAPADRASVQGLSETELTPAVREALQRLMAEVESLRRELEVSRHRVRDLERLVDEDTLLPLPNRRAFVRELARSIAYAERYSVAGAVVYFDVNDLKAINDTLGHAAGDAALARIGTVLAENLRSSDFVARLGGDEFGVILAQATSAQAEEKAAQLARKVAASPLLWDGKTVALSVAYGTHPFHPGQAPDAAIAQADRAMYSQKRGQSGGR